MDKATRKVEARDLENTRLKDTAAEQSPMTAPSITWTPEQSDAIHTRGCDILVAAGAGAGKTAVLVERVIQGILSEDDGFEMERLLVVTFTEAAAAEMRQRIREALENNLREDPDNEGLERQLLHLPLASISTIHAFCSRLLRQHFYHLGLDPGFRIMTEPEANLLKSEIMDIVLDGFYKSAEPNVLRFIDAYGGKDGDGAVRELVLRLYDFEMSLPEPANWQQSVLRACLPSSCHELWELPLMLEAERQVVLKIRQILSVLEQALELCYLPNGPEPYAESLKIEIQALENLLEMAGNRNWDALVHWESPFGRLPSIRKTMGFDEALKERCQKLRDDGKRQLTALQKDFLSRSEADIMRELEAIIPIIRVTFRLVDSFRAEYTRAKARQGTLDFADLEQLALKLLGDPHPEGGFSPSSVALELQQQFDEVLIDEYQDTNGVQDCILAMIAGAHGEGQGSTPRFMVGDIKQSIYGFRLTEPALFLDKYHRFSPDEGAKQRKIHLAMNFRCRQEIIHGVNYIFRQLMSDSIAGMVYDREAELKYGANYPDLVPEMVEVAATREMLLQEPSSILGETQDIRLEVYVLDSQVQPEAADDIDENEELEPFDDDTAELEQLEKEAWLMACRIHRLVNGSPGAEGQAPKAPAVVWDKSLKAYRPVHYRDIVVLLRSVKNRANQIMEIFRQAGIPAYADLGTGYFAAVEIRLMIALLQVLDNPQQDIPLAAVLRAPWFGLSSNELASIRLAGPKESFYWALMAASERGDRLGDRLQMILDCLDRWRTAARRLPLSQLIWYLYQETGFYDYAGSMPKGEQRQANLRGLYDRAREFDQFARKGLSRFVRFLERLQADDDLGEVKPLGEGEDVVRVMSMHKSKGLEFPVVFLADLGKGFNLEDQKKSILLHKELGLGVQIIDPDERTRYSSLSHQVIKGRLNRDTLAEEMRILYVAMTRAREMLILVGSQGSLDKVCSSWKRAAAVEGWVLPDDLLMSAKSYLDWLGPALCRHRDGSPIIHGDGDEPTLPQDTITVEDASRWLVWLEGCSKSLAWFEPNRAPEDRDPALWGKIEKLQPIDSVKANEKFSQNVSRRLLWQYPYHSAVDLPAKLSVTELKRWPEPAVSETASAFFEAAADGSRHTRSQHVARRPRLILAEKERFSAIEKGIWTHTLLQHLDLAKDLSKTETLQDEAMRLVERRLLTEEQLRAIDIGSIQVFFQSALGRRLLADPEAVWREFPFTMTVPARILDGGSAEQIIVQGVIDCLVEEPRGLLLIDFKTDAVTEANASQAAWNYRVQIEHYRQAVEMIFRQPVQETYLYFLAPRMAIQMY